MPKVINDETVFSATIEILVAQGYENATTKAIASAAGIHEATLFRKYGSKFELIDKAIAHTLSDTPLHKLAYTGNLRADLLAILEAYLELSEEHGSIMPLLFVEVARDADLQSFLHQPMKNLEAIFQIIKRYQAEGLLKSENPMATLSALIGPIMVNHMIKRATTELPVPEIDLNQYLDFFLSGRASD